MATITEKHLRRKIRSTLMREVRRSVLLEQEQVGPMGASSEILEIIKLYPRGESAAQGAKTRREVINPGEVKELALIAAGIVKGNHISPGSVVGSYITKREVLEVRSHYESLRDKYVDRGEGKGNFPAVAAYELLFLKELEKDGFTAVNSSGNPVDLGFTDWAGRNGWGSGPAEILHNSLPPVTDLASVIRDIAELTVITMVVNALFRLPGLKLIGSAAGFITGLAAIFYSIKLALEVLSQSAMLEHAEGRLRTQYGSKKVPILMRTSDASLETGTSAIARESCEWAIGSYLVAQVLKKISTKAQDLATAGEEEIKDLLIRQTSMSLEDVEGLDLEAAMESISEKSDELSGGLWAKGNRFVGDEIVEPIVDWLSDSDLIAKILGVGRLLDLARDCRAEDDVLLGAPVGEPVFEGGSGLEDLLKDASVWWNRHDGKPAMDPAVGPFLAPVEVDTEHVKWAIAAMFLDPELYPGDKLVKEVGVTIDRAPGYEYRYEILKGLKKKIREQLSSLVGVNIPTRASRRLPTRDEVYTGDNNNVGRIVSRLLSEIKNRISPE